jgi:2-polyprenyl-3-methyl-5-hydroxy-6-metoxy-1,4-benzoquinol methylase
MSIDETQVRDAWDRNATLWAERVRSGVDRYRAVFNDPSFLAELPDVAGREVIDLGCGEGATTRSIARCGARVTGIDLSPRIEPRPTAEMVAAHPWLERWREHAAIFLYVFAKKPGDRSAVGV